MIFGSEDALNVSMRAKNVRKDWVIDSDAIRHMTSNRDLFTRLDKQKTMVTVANGVKLKSPGRGDIAINLNNQLVRMTNVLYVSNFSCNLLSISALREKGIEMHFELNNIVFVRKGTRIAIGILRRRMYYLESASTNQALINQDSSTAAPMISEDHFRMDEEVPVRPKEMNEYLMWHARMGHAGPNRLLKAVDAVVGMDKKIAVDKDKCVICSFSKMTKVINRLLPLRATKMLERVFSDYWSKYRVVGSRGKGHFLSFMDDYSKMSVVYICDRSETRRHLDMYKNMMERQFGEKLQRIRSDNGREYLAMKISLETNGIHLKTTTTYTSEQNEMAERLNRTLITATRRMLLWSGLPKKF